MAPEKTDAVITYLETAHRKWGAFPTYYGMAPVKMDTTTEYEDKASENMGAVPDYCGMAFGKTEAVPEGMAGSLWI